MDVLYLLTNPARPEECRLPSSARLGLVFSDIAGEEQTGLRDCLDLLQKGDTLYVARERHLSCDFGKAIELLNSLARKGIHVWLGRTGQLLESTTSPFLSLNPAAASAIVNFSKEFTLRKSKLGFQKARKEGMKPGRREKPLPENFAEVTAAWQAGKVTQAEAAHMCGMSVTTFSKKVRK